MKQTHFRTWKSGKKWLYSANALSILVGGGGAVGAIQSVQASATTVTTPTVTNPASAVATGSITGDLSTQSVIQLGQNGIYFDSNGSYTDGTSFSNATFVESSGNQLQLTGTTTGTNFAGSYYDSDQNGIPQSAGTVTGIYSNGAWTFNFTAYQPVTATGAIAGTLQAF